MKSFSIKEIGFLKMQTNPPKEIVNCGFRIINTFDNFIYEYTYNKWVKSIKAEPKDYLNIPQLL